MCSERECIHGISEKDDCLDCWEMPQNQTPARVFIGEAGRALIADGIQPDQWAVKLTALRAENAKLQNELAATLDETREWLRANNATLHAENAKLREILGDCEVAFKTLPDEALGRHPEDGHFYMDELLYNIECLQSPSEPPDSDRGGLNGDGEREREFDDVAAPRRPR